MKIRILAILISALSISSVVSAATGSTSTGSTSTGSTSTGIVSTGSVSTPTTTTGGGGPISAWNYTTKSYEMYPQCFPWAWLLDFYKGNILMIYENQKVCREKRAIDFRF